MSNDNDVAAWNCLMDIDSSSTVALLQEFGDEMRKDLADLEQQVAFYERLRIKNLNNKALRKQAAGVLVGLREEVNELRRITSDKAYQRVDTGSRRRTI